MGLGGNDTLTGKAGFDFLYGGRGNDTYIFNRGDEHDVIEEVNEALHETLNETVHQTINKVAAGNSPTNLPLENQNTEGNIVCFGAGIQTTDLWFTQNENNMDVHILGTNDTLSIVDWFNQQSVLPADSPKNAMWSPQQAHPIEKFSTADGHTIDYVHVTQLAHALAAFAPPDPANPALLQEHAKHNAVINSLWSIEE